MEVARDIVVAEATEDDKPVIRNLGRMYLYDFSEFTSTRCPDDGMFACTGYPQYWQREDCVPFIVRTREGELVGFALVNRGVYGEHVSDIGEFFILRKFRRRGIGQAVAHRIFDRFPGPWIVRQLLENGPAITFWQKVVNRCTGGCYKMSRERVPPDDHEMNVIRFNTPAPAPDTGETHGGPH